MTTAMRIRITSKDNKSNNNNDTNSEHAISDNVDINIRTRTSG